MSAEADLVDLLQRVVAGAEDAAPVSISAGVLRAAIAEIERLRVFEPKGVEIKFGAPEH